MYRLVEFWKRHTTFILAILVFLLVMDFCGRTIVPRPAIDTNEVEEPGVVYKNHFEDGERLKYYEEIIMERESSKRGNRQLLVWLAALAVAGLAGYYAHRKGWLNQLIPGRVSFKTSLLEDKKTRRLLMRLSLSNTTRESQTFLQPGVLFKKSSKVKRFKLKSNDFPLTLTPGTSHSMVIDLEQFWETVTSLSGFNRIGAEIDTTSGKRYTARAVPRWWVFKRF